MLICHVEIEIRFSVKGFAANATSPKVDTILKLAQFLHFEHIVGEVQGTLLWHFFRVFFEHGSP